MKSDLTKIALLALLALAFSPAQAQQVIDEYIAVIGAEDRVNSRGDPLTEVEQILAQDRANFHRFGIRHAGDTGDQFFGVRDNRAALPGLLDRGSLGSGVERAILVDPNAMIRVEVIGRSGRPESLRVSLADRQVPTSAERTRSTGVPEASTATLGSLPTLGADGAGWTFAQDEHAWRGTASVGRTSGFDVTLGCTKPGADPALYPGNGHVRPHEPGVYNLFVDPTSLGGEYGAPGAGTFVLELSIDGQQFGAAPVILLAPEMSLATNIPSNHSFIQGLRSGSTLSVLDQASGMALNVPLSGSSAALDALAAFCTTPLQPSVPFTASPLAPAQAAPAETGQASERAQAHQSQGQTQATTSNETAPSDESQVAENSTSVEHTPTFAPELSCRLGNRSGLDTLYNLVCRYADGKRLDTPTTQRIQAQLALRTLGCDVPTIDGVPTPANGQCYLEMFGLEQQSLTDTDIRYLARNHFYAEKSDLVANLVEMGLVFAESPMTVTDAEAVNPSTQGSIAHAAAQDAESTQTITAPDIGGIQCEKTPWRGSQFRIRCTNADGSAVETTMLRAARAQHGLQVLGCNVPAITGSFSDSSEAVTCFNEMFGLAATNLSANDIFSLGAIAEYTEKERAVGYFKQRGYQLASEQVTPPVPADLELDETQAVPVTPSQDDPVTQARAAGLYGMEPVSLSAVEQVVWDRYGIYFREHNRRAFVAGLRPGGAAAQQGAKVGDVLRGTAISGSNASLENVLRDFHRTLENPNRSLLLYVYDAESRWQREYRLTAAAADGRVAGLPHALRGAATSYPGLMAIVSGDATRAEPIDIARDAMLALQAISTHVRSCSGPDAVTIPVRITVTETTTDGLGVHRGSETSAYGETLLVRPEFANWARKNIGLYPTQVVSTVRQSVLDLITQEGCTGAGFRQLEAGLAAMMGVAFTDAPVVSESGSSEDIPQDASAFVRQCYPLFLQSERNRGQIHPSARGGAQFCMCYEHAARASGDPALYSSVSILDFRYYEENPQLHDAFRAAWDQCYRAPEGSELRQRLEALWHEMGL